MSISRVGLRSDEVVFGTPQEINCRHYCPACGYGPLDGATRVSAEKNDREFRPEAGNYTICFKCAEWLMYFGDPLQLRRATAGELEEIRDGDPDLWAAAEKARWAIRKVRASKS